MTAIISAKKIFKAYKNLQVLKGVNISINESEIISIVGSSGAGKTTLLQILGTLDKPDYKDETQLVINGTAINQLNDKALAKQVGANIELATKVGIDSTPSFIIGDKLFSGGDRTKIEEKLAKLSAT
jgi:predicted ABC-type transport system involved in lysophospholipase L1 biosynthesis ATPase subunit